MEGETIHFFAVNGISDGIVHHLAAKIPGVCALEVLEANHQELVNHPNATLRYDAIMNNTIVPNTTNQCTPLTLGYFFTAT